MSRASMLGFATAFCSEGGLVALGFGWSVIPSDAESFAVAGVSKVLLCKDFSWTSSEDRTSLPDKGERR
jgi:hypothetical protein